MKRLQLTLRDLFWLVLVVALMVGWWLEHRRHRHDAEVMRNLHEMSQTLMERLQQVEQMAAADAPSQDYSGTLVEIIEDPSAAADNADANLDVPSWQSFLAKCESIEIVAVHQLPEALVGRRITEEAERTPWLTALGNVQTIRKRGDEQAVVADPSFAVELRAAGDEKAGVYIHGGDMLISKKGLSYAAPVSDRTLSELLTLLRASGAETQP